jgi:integrase
MGLTDMKVAKLKPKDQRYEATDSKGLSIRVKTDGSKSWFYRFQFNGRPRKMCLGDYPGITFEEARKRHAEAMLDVQQGIDPGKKAKEQRAKIKLSPTFKDLLDEFWKVELSKSPTAKERKRLVDKDVLPTWKNIKVSEIRRRDAVLVLEKVRERAPITANRLQGVLVRMFYFASEQGIIDVSPLAGMRRGKENSRERVLNDEEIKNLWTCLDLEKTEIDIYRLTKLALKTILLTGQRPGEVAGMKWAQLADGWWIIPKEERKSNFENRVPILPIMADIIETAKIYSSDSKFVFRSSHNKKKPLTVGALANGIRRHRTEMKINEQFTPHDLRRTLRTRLADLEVSDVVAELVLGHKLQGIMAVYNRHPYAEEKKQALAAWEKRLNEIIGITESVKTENVIPFPGVQNA